MCQRISLVLLVLTAAAGAAVFETDEFGWANQVVHENGSAKFAGEVPAVLYNVNYAIIDDVDFYLYTQDSKDNPIVTRVGDERLFDGRIDVSKPVKILTHGYFSGRNRFFGKTIREAYLSKFDYNIINVDWSKEAHSMYQTSRHDVPAVGHTLALFIDKLSHQTGIRVEQMHLLGHSLGAHVSGVAGLNVKNGRVMRITGLDPAGPMFSYSDTDRLKPESADFVDVIHTCGHGLGFYDPLGHVDFYPNHGVPNQPGCSISFGKCSHARAVQLYAESLSSPQGFVARKCDHWKDFQKGSCDINPLAYMGEHVSWSARGRYWLKTNSKSPFAMGPEASYGKSGADTGYVASFYRTMFISMLVTLKHFCKGISSLVYTNETFEVENMP